MKTITTTNAGPALDAARAAHVAEGHADGSPVPNTLLPCCRNLVTTIIHTSQREPGDPTPDQGRPRNPFEARSMTQELADRATAERLYGYGRGR